MNPSDAGENIDPVMMELFAAEVEMHLPVLSEGLLAMEKQRAGKEEIESMMRAAHSIKGAARIVGNQRAVRVAHVLEDCFTAAKEERITLSSDTADILLQGVDVLQRICSPQADEELSEAFIASLLERIASVRDGNAAVAAPPAVTVAVAVATAGAATASEPAHLAAPLQDTVVLPAQFDDIAARSLRAQFCDILARGVDRIRIDFGQVDHLNVAAMSLLLSLAREIGAMQPPVTVEARRVALPILALFRVVGLKDALVLTD
jgi:chemotaxis protein histidine kinase CheA